MKRWMISILIISLAVGSLYGCGSVEEKAGEETTVPVEETAEEPEDLQEAEPEATADADAPQVEWLSDVLYTNSLSGKAAADILKYTDASDCTVELTRFTKLANLEVLDDAKVSSYTQTLNQSSSDELLARTTNKAAGEGIYSAVLSVTDTSGNAAAHEVLVVYDKTAPVFEGLSDRTVTQSDVTIEPQVDLSAVTISDNVEGVIDASQVTSQLELEDEAKHIYTLHLSVKDRAGNEAIEYCTVTVAAEGEKKPEETVTASNQPAKTEAKTSGNGSGNASAKPAQQTPQKTVQYETTTTFNMAEGTEFKDSMAKDVLTILNQRRAENGLPALTWDNNLTTVAKVRSLESVSNFSHTRPDGRTFYTALEDQHISYTWGGENLACGQTSADVAMTEWMNSQTHKDNILRSEFKKVGIACYYDPNTTYKYYWVQIFSD